MLSRDDVVTFWLGENEVECAKYHAEECSLGGRSNVRGSDRQTQLSEDQLYGQFCELAGWMAFYGRTKGLSLYNASRESRNENPWESDNGNDIVIGGVTSPIDMKGSKMRYGLDPLAYNLVYPVKEHNDETLYLLGLSSFYRSKRQYVAHVVGFIVGHEMPPPSEFKSFGVRSETSCSCSTICFCWIRKPFARSSSRSTRKRWPWP